MKSYYLQPETSIISVEASAFIAASPQDGYSIGGENSKWPEEGTVIDDTGDGPGVSGAKPGTLDEWSAGN